MAETPTATLEQIAAYTFLTVAELEGAAKSYLPKSQRGLYPITESVKGALRYYSELRTRPVTVNKEELCNISGLSDSRHRQLASEGYFSPPVRGRYDLRSVTTGIIRHFRELHQRRDRELSALKKEKLALEIDALGREKARDELMFVSVDEMVARLTPACSSMRQIILSSTLTDDERDQLIEAMGSLLENALKNPMSRNSKEVAANPKPAATPDGQPVGG